MFSFIFGFDVSTCLQNHLHEEVTLKLFAEFEINAKTVCLYALTGILISIPYN